MDVNYKMEDTVLDTTINEKDLGVTISADIKVSEQCDIDVLRLIASACAYSGIIHVPLNLNLTH